MRLLEGHRNRVNDLAFSPDGRFLASCGNDHTVRVWDTYLDDGTVVLETGGPLASVAFSPDGREVLVRPLWGGLEAWSVADRKRTRTLIAKTSASYDGGLAVAPRAGWVVANEWIPRPFACVVRLWDATTWQELNFYRTSENYSFSGLAFDPTGTRLATAAGVLDVPTGTLLSERLRANAPSKWSPTAPLLATGLGPEVVVRSTVTGEKAATLRLDAKQVQDFAFSPDGRHLAVVSNEERVRIWDTEGWQELPGFAWEIGKLKCIAFAPDGQRVACASHRGTILIWDWEP